MAAPGLMGLMGMAGAGAGAPGAGGPPGAAPGPGASPPGSAPSGGGMQFGPAMASAIGRFLKEQNDMKAVGQMLDQVMLQVGKMMQFVMQRDPELYQHLLRMQTAAHSASQQLKKKGSEGGKGMPALTSSMAGVAGQQMNQKPVQY